MRDAHSSFHTQKQQAAFCLSERFDKYYFSTATGGQSMLEFTVIL